jgi:hypothetical protein
MSNTERGPKSQKRVTNKYIKLHRRKLHRRFDHHVNNHDGFPIGVAEKARVRERDDMRIGLRESMEATDGDPESDFDTSILDWEGVTDQPTDVLPGRSFISEIDPRKA